MRLRVRHTVSLSQETIEAVDRYRRDCKGRIPSFSEAVNKLILQE